MKTKKKKTAHLANHQHAPVMTSVSRFTGYSLNHGWGLSTLLPWSHGQALVSEEHSLPRTTWRQLAILDGEDESTRGNDAFKSCRNSFFCFFLLSVLFMAADAPLVVQIAKAAAEIQNLESIFQEKRTTRLNIVIGRPLFQLQPPPRQKIHSHSSSPDMSTCSQAKSRRRTPKKNMRSHRSLSELENYEPKGFMDLGFTFPGEKLSPQLMTTVPVLQRLAEEGEGRRHSNEECVKRPHLSESWQISSHGSPPFNLQMLSRSPQVADMKKHLRFWARKVNLK